jgi:hypothetical protein
MRIQLQLRLTTDDGAVISDTEVIRLDKGEDRLAMLGLSLDDTLLHGSAGERSDCWRDRSHAVRT